MRNCSNEFSFQEIRSFLFIRLRDRGYDKDFLEAEFSKISYSDQQKYLYAEKDNNSEFSAFYKVTYQKNVDTIELANFFYAIKKEKVCKTFLFELKYKI